MSEKVEIPMSEALACVHYNIEVGDLAGAKGILRLLIRQTYAVERGVPIPEAEANNVLSTSPDGIDAAEEKSDSGC